MAPALRNAKIDRIKGVLITLVVIGHSIQTQIHAGNPERYYNDTAFMLIFSFAMPAFLAVSGYLSWPFIRTATAGGLLIRRVLPLAAPLMAWTALMAVGDMAAGYSATEAIVRSKSTYWFLWALIAGVTALFLIVRSRVPLPIGAVAVTFVALAIPTEGFLPAMVRFSMPFFFAGAVAREIGMRPLSWTETGLIALLGIALLSLWEPQTQVYQNKMSGQQVPLMLATHAAMSIAVVSVLWRVAEVPLLSGFQMVGRHTLAIYLAQAPVFAILGNAADVLQAALITICSIVLPIALNVACTNARAALVMFGRRIPTAGVRTSPLSMR